MREKDFEERVQELREKYEGVNDFDLGVVLQLEDEYYHVLRNNPEHTNRRREILDMRARLLGRMRFKPKEGKKDVYIDVFRNAGSRPDKFIAYCNGKVYGMTSETGTFSGFIEYLISTIGFEDKNIFLDTNGIGVGFADALDKKGIKYSKLEIFNPRAD